jgi:hypothetical protein
LIKRSLPYLSAGDARERSVPGRGQPWRIPAGWGKEEQGYADVIEHGVDGEVLNDYE